MATHALARAARSVARDPVTEARHRARRDAERVLRALWTRGDDEVPLPVDPVVIAWRLGIHTVVTDEIADDLAGSLVKEPDEDPVIVLSERDRPNRQRFVCAHELGHFTGRRGDVGAYRYDDRRGSLFASGDPEEAYANEFAATLLMPADEVRTLVRRLPTEVELAWRFDVSREAMRLRLAQLGLGEG
jgi:hypothetical protein